MKGEHVLKAKPVRYLLVLLVAMTVVAAGCGKSKKSSSTTATTASGAKTTNASGTIALLLPETKTTRYEEADKPYIEAKVTQLCPNCKVLYSNAAQDSARQQQQAEAAITNGAKVMILDPVDSNAAAAIVAKAAQSNVKVIAYDRLVKDGDIAYYISFENQTVGKLQAQSLVDKLKADGKTSGTIVMINGAPTDNNAGEFKAGAHTVLDKSGLTIGKEYDTPDWSADKAQTEMEQSITAIGKDKIIGVYAANDGTAGGAIAAMKSAGMTPLPPVTGQDAEVAGIQRILIGEQYMTIYKPIKPEAEAAAELAVDLLAGTTPSSSLLTGTTNNGTKDVPSVILTPVAVTKDKVKTTIIADKFHSVAEICTGPYAAACTALGIS